MDSDEHGAVSIALPWQESVDGALAQWRSLIFLPQEQEESQADHSPHSVQRLVASVVVVVVVVVAKTEQKYINFKKPDSNGGGVGGGVCMLFVRHKNANNVI